MKSSPSIYFSMILFSRVVSFHLRTYRCIERKCKWSLTCGCVWLWLWGLWVAGFVPQSMRSEDQCTDMMNWVVTIFIMISIIHDWLIVVRWLALFNDDDLHYWAVMILLWLALSMIDEVLVTMISPIFVMMIDIIGPSWWWFILERWRCLLYLFFVA